MAAGQSRALPVDRQPGASVFGVIGPPGARLFSDRQVAPGILAVTFATVIVLALVPLDAMPHMASVALLLALMWWGRALAHSEHAVRWRVFVIAIGLFLMLRYLAWRSLYTLSAPDLVAWLAVMSLFAAEVYSSGIHLLGCVVNVSPLRRPSLSVSDLPANARLPTVDVLVPSYNEAPDILELTLRAALLMRYPRERLRVYLLDDGATEEKLASPDPAVAARARAERVCGHCARSSGPATSPGLATKTPKPAT